MLGVVPPTEFLAQNGLKINESTKISVSGSPKAKKKVRHELGKSHGAVLACNGQCFLYMIGR
jgi:hypothetical protein